MSLRTFCAVSSQCQLLHIHAQNNAEILRYLPGAWSMHFWRRLMNWQVKQEQHSSPRHTDIQANGAGVLQGEHSWPCPSYPPNSTFLKRLHLHNLQSLQWAVCHCHFWDLMHDCHSEIASRHKQSSYLQNIILFSLIFPSLSSGKDQPCSLISENSRTIHEDSDIAAEKMSTLMDKMHAKYFSSPSLPLSFSYFPLLFWEILASGITEGPEEGRQIDG